MLAGHPKGLFRLFFIEMWERLAFYTMVGILLLYTIDKESGGLGYPKAVGNEIYGLYLAFVYFTPYIGGILADRFLGYRRSVLIGGCFFSAGFFLMGMGMRWSFVTGLVFLCIGNGFFKPNISAMVGNLYQPGDPKRDAGFNIFYMGINIGAFVANFLAAVMRNKFNWEAIFIAAGVGMLIGISILLASWKVLEKADREPGTNPGDTPFIDIFSWILGPAIGLGILGYLLAGFLPEAVTDLVRPSDIGFLVGSIPIILFFIRLGTKAEPEEKPGLLALLPIYIAGGTFFMVLHLNGSAMTTWANENTDRRAEFVADNLPLFAGEAYPAYYKNASPDDPRPNKLTLLPLATDATMKNMFGQKRMDDETLAKLVATLPADVTAEEIPQEKKERSDAQSAWSKYAVDIYDVVTPEEIVDSHGTKEITITVADDAEKMKTVAFVRTDGSERYATYLVTQEQFDKLYQGDVTELPPGKYLRTANAELYQSFNAFFVVLLTPFLVAFFALLARRKTDFSTARKIFTGMVLTGLAVLFMALAAKISDNGAVKVSWMWLFGFYGIVTIGELCLSPMALSLVTKLSPRRFVGLTMGGWFFASAVGNKFSGFLGGIQSKMQPTSFFLFIAAGVGAVALFIYLLLPKLDAAIKKYGA